MVSRIAEAAKRPKTCPRCGAEHQTYGTRYCRECYRKRENEKAWDRGVKRVRPKPEIVLGETYGAWTTIEEPEVREGGEQWGTRKHIWGCVCAECGTERRLPARDLGKLPGCGECIRRRAEVRRANYRDEVESRRAARETERENRRLEAREKIEEAKERRVRQGLEHSRHPLYMTWNGMRCRCLNPKDTSYANYGGRGIAVCVEWAKDFGAFRDYAEEHLGPKPEGMSIDRIDNDGHYEPGNVRWATQKEQAWNTRSNLMLTIDGVTKKFLEWAKEYGLDRKTTDRARSRIAKGWEAKEALTAPEGFWRGGGPSRPAGFGLLTKEQVQEVEGRGLTVGLVRSRVDRGWPLERAMTAPRGTVYMKAVECWYCGEVGHVASAHPDYEEWLRSKLARV